MNLVLNPARLAEILHGQRAGRHGAHIVDDDEPHALAVAGHKVILLDKAPFPREKPCGGGLTINVDTIGQATPKADWNLNLAGNPGDRRAAEEAAGVDEFVHVGVDVLGGL